jgi:hypothetical protein
MQNHNIQQAELTPAEEKLIKAAAEGSVADYRLGKDDDPAKGEQCNKARTLRAEILCELAAGSTWPVHRKGIRVAGAKITGSVDLEQAIIAHPLAIEFSHFEKPLLLENASMRAFSLRGSYLADGIRDDGLHVQGNVFLNLGFHATGEVGLSHSQIGGQLNCDGSRFENPHGIALRLANAEVKRELLLRKLGQRLKGVVNFSGAKVGQLCDDEQG